MNQADSVKAWPDFLSTFNRLMIAFTRPVAWIRNVTLNIIFGRHHLRMWKTIFPRKGAMYEVVFIVTSLFSVSMASAASEDAIKAVVSLNKTSIVMNGVVRIAAIMAGVYIVWLGHNAIIRGVKGDFEFEGKFAKLKGSTPGLLFVLLGSLAIGWSLNTPAKGDLNIDFAGMSEPQKPEKSGSSSGKGVESSNKDDGEKTRPSDSRPGFLGPVKGE